MNDTPTSGFFNQDSFAEEAKPGILEVAHEAFREFEGAYIGMTKSTSAPKIHEFRLDTDYFSTQSALLIGMSIAKDLKRIADALERRHV